ncbi:hypothetical protein DRO97_04050 [Archaeoglobales archaeon]|nr:MAG: hypothetical protein DRO97_04050 [Archaeoglobales archaeon]
MTSEEERRKEVIENAVLIAAESLFKQPESFFKVVDIIRTDYGYTCHVCVNAPTLYLHLPIEDIITAEASIAHVKVHPDMEKGEFRLEFLFNCAKIGENALFKFTKCFYVVRISDELKPQIKSIFKN